MNVQVHTQLHVYTDHDMDPLKSFQYPHDRTSPAATKQGLRVPLLALLVQYLDLPTMLPYLRTRNLVTSDEYLQLSGKWAEGRRQSAVMDLVSAILPRKRPTWEEELMEVLEASVQPGCLDVHAGHEYILQCVAIARDRSGESELTQAVQEVCRTQKNCICGCIQLVFYPHTMPYITGIELRSVCLNNRCV